ncbi:hypothetical protein [Paenibacillus solani]|nr:hypothetical protein [Paenibacillus solani]
MMDITVDSNDYFKMNGRPDDLWRYLDCYQLSLYFALKDRMQLEAEPYAIFLENPSFYVDIDENNQMLKDIIIRFPWNPRTHHIFDVEMYSNLGNKLFNNFALELSKGHLVPFSTFPKRVPFYKNFVSVESEFNISEHYEVFDHIFMAIKIENNKLIYIENPSLLNKSHVPYNGNRNFGIIDLAEVEPAFSCYLKYFKITIDTNKISLFTEVDYLLDFCKQTLAFSDSQSQSNENSIHHPNIKGLKKLIELLKNEMINLEGKAHFYNCNYCELLEWRLSIIQQKSYIFLQYLKQNQFEIQGINHLLSSLEHANKMWFALITMLRLTISRGNYQENTIIDHLNNVINAEVTLLEDIRNLVEKYETKK